MSRRTHEEFVAAVAEKLSEAPERERVVICLREDPDELDISFLFDPPLLPDTRTRVAAACKAFHDALRAGGDLDFRGSTTEADR